MLWISVLIGILAGIVAGSIYGFSKKLFLVSVIFLSGILAIALSMSSDSFLLYLQNELFSWDTLLKLVGFIFGLYPGNDLGQILRGEIKRWK